MEKREIEKCQIEKKGNKAKRHWGGENLGAQASRGIWEIKKY